MSSPGSPLGLGLRTRHALAIAVFGSVAAGTGFARADLTLGPPDSVKVPLELTLVGQEAFAGQEIVVHGCNDSSRRGRHTLGFPRPNEVLTCSVRSAPEVFVVGPEDAKALHELVARDIGWGPEVREASKLLAARAWRCGAIEVDTRVKKSSGIEKIALSYQLVAKEPNGCSLVKRAAGASPPSSAASPSSASPGGSSSSSASPDGASPGAATSTASPGNGGCTGCTVPRPGPREAPMAYVLLAALGLLRAIRRQLLALGQ